MMLIYKPEKFDVLDKVINRDVEEFVVGFSKPTYESKPTKKKKEKLHHDEPEILIADPNSPDDLECPEPRVGGTKFKNEERCRAILEKIYGKKFPSVRPTWLRNPATKRCLEIDCYNHELRLGLERNGKQHYQKTKFHKTKNDVIYQFRKDQWKLKRCQELGIQIISVPYWVRPEELENYIRENLIKVGKLDPPQKE